MCTVCVHIRANPARCALRWDGAAAIAEVVDAGAFYEIGQHNNGEANPTANAIYSETELQLLSSIAEEAANLFPTGKLFESPHLLRDEVREFAHKKGFAVTSEGYCWRSQCWGVLMLEGLTAAGSS